MYSFISDNRALFRIATQCRVLGASKSGYYSWCSGESYVTSPQEELEEQAVIRHFWKNKRRYGVRRLYREVKKREGVSIDPYRVRKLMGKHKLKAIQPRSFVPRTTNSRHPYPISPNLTRGLVIDHPNQVWASDITYVPVQGGQWAYLAVWMDLYARTLIGWALESHMEESLVIKAFKAAARKRKIPPGMITHSDRGGQYAGTAFRKLLGHYQIRQSMSDADNPYDNAFMESYFSRFKAEVVEDGVFENIEDARTEIFEFIEQYYNIDRLHSSLNYLTPDEYEKNY